MDIHKHAKIISLGIFSSQMVKGTLLTNSIACSIYNKLKTAGFLETKWQYIYEGQLAGLVLPHRNGKNEIHIRFYNNRIYAEFEIGRAYLTHFWGKRFNANKYILEKYKGHFDMEELSFLKESFSDKHQTTRELNMPSWDGEEDPFRDTRNKERTIFLGGLLAFFYMIDTKAILLTSFFFLTFVLSVTFGISLFFSFLAAALGGSIIWYGLPSQGNPK